MRLVSVLLLALVACGDDATEITPWPVPIAGDLDAGRRLDAGVRDAAPDADQRDARSR